jgi:predicted negative regulator of RcsB-dependent stress response
MKVSINIEVSVARITRKELKSDKFAQDVGLTVDFFEEHRQDLVRYGTVAVVVALLIVGYGYYSRHRHAVRQEALYKALEAAETPVGPPQQPGVPSFPNEQAKEAQTTKLFTDLANNYGGSAEGNIAEYFLGSLKADQGDLPGAEKYLLVAADKGDDKYGSLAKLSLAQIYFQEGRSDQGEKTLRDLMAHPTIFVSSDQSAIVLARQIMPKNPAEARKLLQPLTSKPGGTGQAATELIAEIPQ